MPASLSHAGIGRAVVKALAQCGAEVIAFSRTQADLDSLKQEVRIAGSITGLTVISRTYCFCSGTWCDHRVCRCG